MTRALRPTIPRREPVTLLAYLETGSHKAAAHRLGINESTCRQRVSQLLQRLGARNAAQAVWALRAELSAEVEATALDGRGLADLPRSGAGYVSRNAAGLG